MSKVRRFLNEPANSVLEVLVVTDPPGSATTLLSFATNGVGQGTHPAQAGIMQFPCPQPASTYIVRVDKAWLAAGRVVVTTWLSHPDGTVVHRDPIVLSGTNGTVDSSTISVLTA